MSYSSAVEPVGLAEIAERLGVKRTTAVMWRQRGLLPAPRWTVSGAPAWDWTDIDAWARRTGRHLHSGKVRELYDAGEHHLLMVASDRISAFDVIMGEPIPDKGRVLTAMTAFWAEELADLTPGTIVSCDPAVLAAIPGAAQVGALEGRAMLVRRAEMLPLECIVRGYLAGSAYAEYRRNGTVHGMSVRPGLELASRLPEPMFTPSTKVDPGGPGGAHDENLSVEQAAALVGADLVARVQTLCLALYDRAAARAADAGFVLADTKFELGFVDGELCLCDEVVTPDSSRLWPAAEIVVGETPPAFDKQPLRDWLEAQDWDKRPPPPTLPPEIVAETSARYVAAYERVTGRRLADWYGASR
jgi:phosphoribosylaminoimidazole-succinocarboxamide synthase